MDTIQTVHCPNCGKFAQRKHYRWHQFVETACPACDYLLISCSLTGNVLEAYAPGITMAKY